MAGFLSKLTGADNNNDGEDDFSSDMEYSIDDVFKSDEDEISLIIDAFEDADSIFIKTFIPSIDPKGLDIDVSRDTVSISGERYYEESEGIEFFQKELSWGKFHKKILLPKEVDIESVKATVNLGVLTLKLSKIDKDRKKKINIG